MTWRARVGWSSPVARRAHNPKAAGLYPPLMRDSDRCTNERRLRSIPSWKRFVIKLLPSCYPGVTPCVHNVGYQKPRCSSPFPFITPGAPGFGAYARTTRLGHPEPRSTPPEMQRSPDFSSSRASRLEYGVEMHRTTSSGIMHRIFVVRRGERIGKEESNVCTREQDLVKSGRSGD